MDITGTIYPVDIRDAVNDYPDLKNLFPDSLPPPEYPGVFRNSQRYIRYNQHDWEGASEILVYNIKEYTDDDDLINKKPWCHSTVKSCWSVDYDSHEQQQEFTWMHPNTSVERQQEIWNSSAKEGLHSP